MEETSREAREIFQKNADTIVAGFLVRHPDVDPSDIRLIYEIIGSTMRFRVEYLPLHVPPVRHDFETVDGTAYTVDEEQAHNSGWNAARQWVLDQAQSAIAPDGLVITLAQVRELQDPAPEPIKLADENE